MFHLSHCLELTLSLNKNIKLKKFEGNINKES